MDLIQQALAEGVHGFLEPSELAVLVEQAKSREVLEIGSFRGLSAWGMARTAKSVTCVDTFRADGGGQVQMPELTTLEEFRRAVSRYRNVETFIGTSEEAAKAMPDRMWDMVFIDAMHDYENVSGDIRRWWPRVRPGGVIAMHDYNHWSFQDVIRAVDEAFGPAKPGEVTCTLRVVCKS